MPDIEPLKAHQTAITKQELQDSANPAFMISAAVEYGISKLLGEGVLRETIEIKSRWDNDYGMVVRVVGSTEEKTDA
jgi:hypothetical protein